MDWGASPGVHGNADSGPLQDERWGRHQVPSSLTFNKHGGRRDSITAIHLRAEIQNKHGDEADMPTKPDKLNATFVYITVKRAQDKVNRRRERLSLDRKQVEDVFPHSLYTLCTGSAQALHRLCAGSVQSL